ncbi:MAG: hypothetical protein RLZZ153_1811 [Pseudomonadota bacterium]|jgi:hypothetical protein
MNDSHWSALLPSLRWLGYGGLIPFAALALASWLIADPASQALSLELLRGYGLAIVSFVGAISWGIALVLVGIDDARRIRLLVWSVVPSLMGFASIALSARAGCLALAATAAIALAVDLRIAHTLALPSAWRQLRIHLSLGAMGALLLGAYAAQ